MRIRYGKQFSRDLDDYRLEEKTKKRLLTLLESIKAAQSTTDINNIRKIEGYSGYYRIRIGNYRLGLKVEKNQVELIRFLHRKDIYRRFP